MATPGQLIKTVASVLGLEEVHVASHYRHLREAGLVAKAGRGTSAAKMTARDAAHLLLSIIGGNLAKDAAETVNNIGRLEAASFPSNEELYRDTHNDRIDVCIGKGSWELGPINIPRLPHLPGNHSPVDAVAALIEEAAEGSLVNAASSDPWPANVVLPWGNPCTPVILVQIRWARDNLWGTVIVKSPNHPALMLYYPRNHDYRANKYDLHIERSFGDHTLIAVGMLLRS